jgi:hypothetical protein
MSRRAGIWSKRSRPAADGGYEMSEVLVDYPQFVIFDLTDIGPLLTYFETSKKANEYLKKSKSDITHLAVFKNRKLITDLTLDTIDTLLPSDPG